MMAEVKYQSSRFFKKINCRTCGKELTAKIPSGANDRMVKPKQVKYFCKCGDNYVLDEDLKAVLV